MKSELPIILSAGLFESAKRYPNMTVSRVRTVHTFELEYYFEDGNSAVINDKAHPVRRGSILFARPGDTRYSRLHFTCRFIHFLLPDPRLAAALEGIPPVSPAADTRKTDSMFADIISHFYSGDPLDNLAASAELIMMLRELSSPEAPGPLIRAQRFIESSYAADLTAQDIADACSVSVSWLYKLFREALDTTPGEYLMRCRLAAAKDLLTNTPLPLSEIAFRCGFNSQSYFSDCFRRSAGISPKDYRKNSTYML